jgi:hypothetical protein
MRIANRKSDPGYHPDWQSARVFLDGKPIRGFCHVADEEQGFITRYKRDLNGDRVIENGDGVIETLHGVVKIEIDPIAAAKDRYLRFHQLHADERGEILMRHLTAAEKEFHNSTGTDHLFFGVETAAHYCDWLMLLEPDAAKELLEALIAVNARGFSDKAGYETATLRLRRAKMNLHIALKARPPSSSRAS